MNRVIKAAVAVATFGLAAALSAPAMAQDARPAGDDPISSLLGGLLGGMGGGSPLDSVTGLLGGGGSPLDSVTGLLGGVGGGANPLSSLTGGAGDPLSAVTGLTGGLGGVTGALPGMSASVKRVVPMSSPVPELDVLRTVDATLLNGQDLAMNTPVDGVLKSVNDLVEGLLGSTSVDSLTGGGMPQTGTVSTLVDSLSTTADTVAGTVKNTTAGLTGLAEQQNAVAGLTAAIQRAVPQSGAGELAPLVGQLAPVETAPVVASLPGVADAASVDEISPLVESATTTVESNGTKATDAVKGTLNSVAQTAAAVTELAGR
ncbi:hypothetical protein ACIBG8_50210 [Nonomuraea sp. NPDC050556]|uniref:hypothetical protein n=1 Tax=Nonomuraea sp. NPDC050556 TaxID=3364369 RepID=UPI00378CA9EA